jgi:hypothetical protein
MSLLAYITEAGWNGPISASWRGVRCLSASGIHLAVRLFEAALVADHARHLSDARTREAECSATGPALLVCNHVSYVDWMLIWAAVHGRCLCRLGGWKKNPLLRLFCRHQLDPIDGNAGPKAIVAALKRSPKRR